MDPAEKRRQLEVYINSIDGDKFLPDLLQRRELRNITSDVIRIIFTAQVKEAVGELDPAALGQICALCEKLNASHEYRDYALVTQGPNSWSGIMISSTDSGLVLLEKIATASMLAQITFFINDGMPNFPTAWPLHEILTADELHKLQARKDKIKQVLGW